MLYSGPAPWAHKLCEVTSDKIPEDSGHNQYKPKPFPCRKIHQRCKNKELVEEWGPIWIEYKIFGVMEHLSAHEGS